MADEPDTPPEPQAKGPLNGTPPGKGTVFPEHGGRIGNPRHEYSEELAREIRTMAKVCNQKTAAKALKISRGTIAKHYQRDWDEGRAEGITRVGGLLLQKALNGNLGAMIFWLKTQAKEDYSQRIEHTGADGRPIETVDLSLFDEAGLAEYERLCRLSLGLGPDDELPDTIQ